MRIFTFVITACLLLVGCKKNETPNPDPDKFPLESIEQQRINSQFIGFWMGKIYAAEHRYYIFNSHFTFNAFDSKEDNIIYPTFVDYYPIFDVIYEDNYYFEDGPECSKGKVYKVVLEKSNDFLACIYNDVLYCFATLEDPELCVGNPDYAFQKVVNTGIKEENQPSY